MTASQNSNGESQLPIAAPAVCFHGNWKLLTLFLLDPVDHERPDTTERERESAVASFRWMDGMVAVGQRSRPVVSYRVKVYGSRGELD